MPHNSPKYVLIYGPRGALGSALVQAFTTTTTTSTYTVIGLTRPPCTSTAHHTLTYTTTEQLITDLDRVLDGEKLCGVISVAGGWVGGDVGDVEVVEKVGRCWGESVVTSVVASFVAGRYLKSGGLLILTGALPALHPTPTMLAYGLCKSAIHHLTQSLGSPSSGLPPSTKAIAILPATLDTPSNRANMPDADTSKWTPLSVLSERLVQLVEEGHDEVRSGQLLVVRTEDGGKTVLEPVDGGTGSSRE